MGATEVLSVIGYTVAVLVGCFFVYKFIVHLWRKEEDSVESYTLPYIALSICRKKSCCTAEQFQRIVREQIRNDEIVKSISPLGSSMFIIEIDIRDFNDFESEYGSVVNIVRHFMNLRIPNQPLPKSSPKRSNREESRSVLLSGADSHRGNG